MRELLDQPGSISSQRGGSELRSLYLENAADIDVSLMTPFAEYCFLGHLSGVRQAVESGNAPDILGTETPYSFGYAALVVYGAQRLVSLSDVTQFDHTGTLRYLLSQGAPPDTPDVLGYTALHHTCAQRPRPGLTRILLEHGADPDKQDRFGCVPLLSAMRYDCVECVGALLEFGASLDIRDADGDTPDAFTMYAGPRIAAAVQRWKRKRTGETHPLDRKACATCGKANVVLKKCAQCQAIFYCSRECQRAHWPQHRLICVGGTLSNTVTVIPWYEDIGHAWYPSDLLRVTNGISIKPPPKRTLRTVHIPNIPSGQSKKFIIKVQVPFDVTNPDAVDAEVGDLMVYDKRRDLVCRIRRQDCEEGYLRLSRTVRRRGLNGLKAYFSAEMHSPDELGVNVSKVLPEQDF
ncbi:ankyrin [Trametes coccinea BRFM310]|uniref:protein S-acyltransferase n=1 Tax=Trametes coccinea (strain BRFM310) TaxID=1353009 RepID=A0A1Y2IAB0_TRAC3|nr:ankyrin [Trametes coccinea BRFM310]